MVQSSSLSVTTSVGTLLVYTADIRDGSTFPSGLEAPDWGILHDFSGASVFFHHSPGTV
jgi:hypothetical protein